MTEKYPRILDHKSKSIVQPSYKSLSICFADDPAFRLLLSKPHSQNLLDSRPFRDRLFKTMITVFATSNCTVTSVFPDEDVTLEKERDVSSEPSWPTVGVYTSPGGPKFRLETLRLAAIPFAMLALKAGIYRLRYASRCYRQSIKPMKDGTFNRHTIRKEDFYSVAFLGTLPEYRGRGLGAAFLRHLQDIASEHRNGKGELEPKAIWLESSSKESRRLYERVGFEVMTEVRDGVGVLDERGFRREEVEAQGRNTDNLPGVAVWGMVWWPDDETRRRYCA